jgi:large subunit ribosomal protein L19
LDSDMVSESDDQNKKPVEAKAEEPAEAKAEEPAEAKAEEPVEAKAEVLNHIQDFQPGDTISVNFKIIEGERQRIQSFEGNVISGKKRLNKLPKIGQNFVVRRLSYGVGVERIVPFYSPNIDSVKVIRKGKVRRAKLYYLRGLSGKKARIKERI